MEGPDDGNPVFSAVESKVGIAISLRLMRRRGRCSARRARGCLRPLRPGVPPVALLTALVVLLCTPCRRCAGRRGSIIEFTQGRVSGRAAVVQAPREPRVQRPSKDTDADADADADAAWCGVAVVAATSVAAQGITIESTACRRGALLAGAQRGLPRCARR
jgi:hypothetical protein